MAVADVVSAEEVGGVGRELHCRKVPLSQQHVHVVIVDSHEVSQHARVTKLALCKVTEVKVTRS